MKLAIQALEAKSYILAGIIMAPHQIPFALVEGPDSVVQFLYGNRHPVSRTDNPVRSTASPLIHVLDAYYAPEKPCWTLMGAGYYRFSGG